MQGRAFKIKGTHFENQTWQGKQDCVCVCVYCYSDFQIANFTEKYFRNLPFLFFTEGAVQDYWLMYLA